MAIELRIPKPKQLTEPKYDCEECEDVGFIFIEQDGYQAAKKCKCQIDKENLKRITQSGLEDNLKRCNFENFIATEEYQKHMLNMAKEFINQSEFPFFFIGGQVGSGKTHVCTAISRHYLDKKYSVAYKTYDNVIRNLKANVNDSLYDKIMYKLQNVEVLYIDDLFKTGKTERPTDADIRHMFNLVNHRYIKKAITIFSSERNIDEIIDIDEGLGSRIKQSTGKFCLSVKNGQGRNYRLK
jgi:DNA replication protein DnaC